MDRGTFSGSPPSSRNYAAQWRARALAVLESLLNAHYVVASFEALEPLA